MQKQIYKRTYTQLRTTRVLKIQMNQIEYWSIEFLVVVVFLVLSFISLIINVCVYCVWFFSSSLKFLITVIFFFTFKNEQFEFRRRIITLRHLRDIQHESRTLEIELK